MAKRDITKKQLYIILIDSATVLGSWLYIIGLFPMIKH